MAGMKVSTPPEQDTPKSRTEPRVTTGYPSRSFVRSSVLLDFRRLALSLGLDPLALMARASISRRYLEDPELILPMGEVVHLLQISAEVSGVDDFGIRLAEMRGLPDLGPIMLMLREETSVRTALKSLAAMLHLHSDALYLYLDERDREPIFAVDIIGPDIGHSRQAIETSVAGAAEILRWLLGQEWVPVLVCFRHDRPISVIRHEHLFRCPLAFNFDFNGIMLRSEDLDRALPATSPVFRRQVERLLQGVSAGGGPSYLHRVTQIVAMLLPHGDATAANVARLAGTSARSLNRNLARFGTNYSQLLSALRRDRVTQILNNRNQSLTEVAGQLGFGSLSAFSRWFRETYGTAPRAWRKGRT